MRLPTLCFSVLFFVIGTYGDIYLHNPRGSNNRLNEKTRPRANANRLFDSQNNNRGGYNVGEKSMYYYAGSELPIEWTNQHSCGHPNANCEVIIQYMCRPRIRDGLNTGTVAENFFGACDPNKGMHENYRYYLTCKKTERNKGLFTADQKLKGDTAIYTRQNPGGTRRGFECPEERDYYPYWRPSPWKDIVIMTNNVSRCAYYKAESQNVKEKYYCRLPQRQTKFRSVIPITKEACEQLVVNGERANWVRRSSRELPAPDCIEAKWSRDNHLGNGKGGFTNKYMWKLPNIERENCVIRIRYNISTNDYDSWNTFSEANKPTTGSDHTKINIGKIVELTEDQAKSRGYVFKNNPQIEILKDNKKLKLRLAINTAQYGRTFQDRTHVFSIRKRPESLKNVRIVNMNVRGKRGNIVQVYPAVEYDFVPNRATVRQGEYVHFQWTGANTNPRNNAGQGAAGTDRSNVALLQSQRYPEGNPNAITPKKVGQFGVNYPAHLDTCMVTSLNFDRRFLLKLALQGLDFAYFDAEPWKTTTTGTFFYFSTRNNAFTNRSQKGKLVVMPPTSNNTSSDSNNSPSKRKANVVELENNQLNEVSRDDEWQKLE